MRPLRIVVADDHTLVRAGIRSLLDAISGMQVVGEAADGHAALQRVKALAPDIALLDISMPGLNGLDTLARVVKEAPRTRVIMLSMHADGEYARHALRVGAAGYLVKSADRHELELAMRAVARGEVWVSSAVARPLIKAWARGEPRAGVGPFERLTTRQREILQLIAEGHSSKEIAASLGLSTKTVEAHRTGIMKRLGIRGVPGLVRYAIKVGIVQAET